MTSITDALDELFENAERAMGTLGEEFTSQQLLRKIAQHNQRAYIDLLYACKDNDHPFNTAHKQLGLRLKKVAQSAGYTQDGFETGDYDIFGGSTDQSKFIRKR